MLLAVKNANSVVIKRVCAHMHRVYPLNFNIFSMTSPWIVHVRSFKIKDLLHSSCHELPPVLPLRTTHNVPVIVQEDVEGINISLYWNAGWKKRTTPFREGMPFNFHDFLWIFQNLESISMTFPGLEKENGIPWLFQVFHDWIHPVCTSSRCSFWVWIVACVNFRGRGRNFAASKIGQLYSGDICGYLVSKFVSH